MKKKIECITNAYPDNQFIKADGFDDAIIGVSSDGEKLVYSRKKAIKILIFQGMDEEEANEHFDYNVSGAYVDDKTPIWVDDTMFESLTQYSDNIENKYKIVENVFFGKPIVIETDLTERQAHKIANELDSMTDIYTTYVVEKQ